VPADHQAAVKELAKSQAELTIRLLAASSAGAKEEVEPLVAKISGNLRTLKLVAHGFAVLQPIRRAVSWRGAPADAENPLAGDNFIVPIWFSRS
jgi:hypothetical protein